MADITCYEWSGSTCSIADPGFFADFSGGRLVMQAIRIIKKYPNRRLYDTEIGEYITLDDVKNLVFNKVNFQVIDARTKKDLTQSTLLQVIAEQEATSTPIFTTALLQDLIRSYQEKTQNLFSQYLEQAANLFIQQKKLFQNQWLSYQKLLADPDLLKQLLKYSKNNEEKNTSSSPYGMKIPRTPKNQSPKKKS
jgi:polyhydroxyalkanoate synthesis repressor PhaR